MISFNTFGGVILGFVVIIGSIAHASDDLGAFLAIPELIIVWVGAFSTVLSSYEFKNIIESFRAMGSTYMRCSDLKGNAKTEIGIIIRWAYIVQKNGMQGLEGDLPNVDDDFLKTGAELVVTGYTGAEIRELLVEKIENAALRRKDSVDIIRYMAANTPAWGMIGTLFGLVIMLGNMGSDPGAIGASMSIAFMATFYGVSTARILLLPPSERYKQRASIIRFHDYLKAEGLYLISERKSPRYIQDKLNAYVEGHERFNIDTDMPEKP